jgi:hypothetical protein
MRAIPASGCSPSSSPTQAPGRRTPSRSPTDASNSRRIAYAEKNVDGHIVPGSKTGDDRTRSVTLLAPLRRDLLVFRLAAGNPPG